MNAIDKTHHSYFLEGNIEKNKEKLFETLEKSWGVKKDGNPDFITLSCETFSIEDARRIKEIASKRAFNPPLIIALTFNFIGVEAQNALLKTLEEPGEDTYFFILSPTKTIFLPTVLSRLLSLDIALERKKESTSPEVLKFLKSSPEDRLKQLTTFLSHESETKKSDLINFLSDIEKEMVKNGIKKSHQEIHELLVLKNYLFDRSPSVKMIAEYLALRLPTLL